MTAADNIPPSGLGPVGYRKPAVLLLTLRNQVVGPDLFDAAFREYIRSWSFKHPTPGDFFRTIENATGRDLSWYWREFWYTTDLLDIAIDDVSRRTQDGEDVAVISLHRNTPAVFPVRLRLKYSDGTTADFQLPVNVWASGDRVEAIVPAALPVVGARLWPDASVPDWDSDNDVWGDAPAADPVRKVTQR
jgi:hypothetical protein